MSSILIQISSQKNPTHLLLHKSAAIREAWGTRIGLPTASWMIEIGTFFMRTESELVLKSRQVIPGRLLAAGFEFNFPHWPDAAQELVFRWRAQKFSV